MTDKDKRIAELEAEVENLKQQIESSPSEPWRDIANENIKLRDLCREMRDLIVDIENATGLLGMSANVYVSRADAILEDE